ncbi:MAG: porin [Opitutaceae bacterium]|nr:porin [Opitutaceae bacterium]
MNIVHHLERLAIFGVAALTAMGAVQAAEIKISDGAVVNVGLRVQTWAQWTDHGAADGSDKIDFSARRLYLYFGGKVTPALGYFAHVAGDRLGQEGVDTPSLGLGSGMALRDGWVSWTFADGFKAQLGRMYVPFLRAYGTESTFTLLTMDVAQFQQGGMVPGRRVGRDDGIALWGNFFGGKAQYRAAVMDRADTSGRTGAVRVAGRFAWNFFDPESDWFNAGTYLTKKRVLSLGGGFDRLDNFIGGIDHRGWTLDGFLNLPVANGSALTVECAVARIAQDHTRYTGNYYFATAGVLLPWAWRSHRFQPFVRYEKFDLDRNVVSGTNDDHETAAGLNWYPLGPEHKAKVTFDWTSVKPRNAKAYNRATTQLQISY